MTDFGIFTKMLRVKREIKKKDMAKMLGISNAHLSLMEAGNRTIKQDIVKKIIKTYQLDGDEIANIWEAYYNSGFYIRFDLNEASYKKAMLIRTLKKEFENIDDNIAEKLTYIIKQED